MLIAKELKWRKFPIQSNFTDRGLAHSDAKTDLNYRAGYLAVGMDQLATIIIITIETFIYCIS